jgi:hypothetical protein
MNPMDLKRGVDIAVAAVVKDIERRSKKVQTSEEIAQIGTVAANGDKTIGKMIADAMKKVGNEGVIAVEEAKTAETELDVVEGMQFNRGYLSGLQGPSLDKTDDQRVGIRIVHARRNAGEVRRTARGSFRRANDIVRGDVAAHAHDITVAAVFNEKVVVGQSAGERNGRYTPAPAGQRGGQGDRILSRHGAISDRRRVKACRRAPPRKPAWRPRDRT